MEQTRTMKCFWSYVAAMLFALRLRLCHCNLAHADYYKQAVTTVEENKDYVECVTAMEKAVVGDPSSAEYNQ
jgi:hypothetical protein